MQKIWLVIRHEYRRHVLRRGFLFAILGMPLILGLIFAGSFFFASRSDSRPLETQPMGLIAPTSVTQREPTADDPILLFDDEPAALAALEAGDISGYAVAAEDYFETGDFAVTHAGALRNSFAEDDVEDVLFDYLRPSLIVANLPADAPADQVDVLTRRPDVTFESLSDPEDERNPLAFLAPFFMGIFFLVSTMTTAGYLIQAVVDEKENRTMEILITSLTPTQLMSGKILGLIGVGLTQLSAWVLMLLLAVAVVRSRIDLPFPVTLDGATIGVAVAWFVPLYVAVGALFAAIGISVTQVSEGRETAGPISLLVTLPLYLTWLLFENPNSTLALIMSFIPFSSPITMVTRMQFTEIPMWQYVVSWSLLALTAVLALWAVGRLLRVGMLRYGQRLSWREMQRALVRPQAS